jgi:Uma2 family endonuclease
VDIAAREEKLYELIDGVLVQKSMGFYEGYIACLLVHALVDFVRKTNAGIVNGPDGTLRLTSDQVRIPDVSFVSWERLPSGELPKQAMPLLSPNLAVEIISSSNTAEEMNRKLREYFEAGVELVWYVYPESRTVRVFTSVDDAVELSENDSLDGGMVLDGFSMSLKELFKKPQQNSE